MEAESRAVRGVEILVVALYVATVAFGVAVHEPWFDEAQAWLLARDAGPFDLLAHWLRYEGHPPLWYWILSIPAKAHLPYRTINVVSALIGTCGVALLVRARRVPLALKAAIPFTYFLAYQYTVVSRSYVLLFPLLVLLLGLYPQRRERLGAFTGCLVLLSLVSLHGLSLAGAFALLYAIDLLAEGRAARRRGEDLAIDVKAHAVAAAALLATVAFVAWVLRPPPDLAVRYMMDFRFMPQKMAAYGGYGLSTVFGGLHWGAAIVAVLFAVWFARRGTLLAFLVLVASLLPISSVYFNLWHGGLFVLVVLFVVLLTCTRIETYRTFDVAMVAAATLLCAVQALWTVGSLRYDATASYSGSLRAARFIERYHLQDRRLFGVGMSAIALEPYFPRNVLSNYAPPGGGAFWDWSTRNSWWPAQRVNVEAKRRWFDEQLAAQPDYVVVGIKFGSEVNYLRWFADRPDYHLVARFPGALCWKGEIHQPESFFLFERLPPRSS